MGHVGVGWGGSCMGGAGWIMYVGWGGVGHVGVGWGGSQWSKWVKIIDVTPT